MTPNIHIETYLSCISFVYLQLFGKPVAILENKTQKKTFDNAEPPKVIGYFQEKNTGKSTKYFKIFPMAVERQ
jgi:hypothetical protein